MCHKLLQQKLSMNHNFKNDNSKTETNVINVSIKL